MVVRACGLGLYEHTSDRRFEIRYQESWVSLKGSAQEQGTAENEIQQLRSELQQMMEEEKASMTHSVGSDGRVHC